MRTAPLEERRRAPAQTLEGVDSGVKLDHAPGPIDVHLRRNGDDAEILCQAGSRLFIDVNHGDIQTRAMSAADFLEPRPHQDARRAVVAHKGRENGTVLGLRRAADEGQEKCKYESLSFHLASIALWSLFVACGDAPPVAEPVESPSPTNFQPDVTLLTECDPLSVSHVSFSGPQGKLLLRREGATGHLVPVGQTIEGFDERTATLLIATACGLRARQKVDENEATQAFGANTSTVELELGPEDIVQVTVGADLPTRRLTFIKVSTVPGIFLVPLHIARALRAGPSRLARTPEKVAADEEAARQAVAHAELHKHHRNHQPQPLPPAPSVFGAHRPGEPVSDAVLEELRRRTRQVP